MSFRITHESRPLPSWLIFDVRQQMTARLRAISSFFLIALLSGCQAVRVDEASLGNALVEEHDPKWAPYASYLRRAIARVQKQWVRELVESRLPPPVGATVIVVFWLSSEGRVSRIEEVKSQADGAGTKACLSAITRAGTFGPWTEEMKKLLAAEEKLPFTFHYEK